MPPAAEAPAEEPAPPKPEAAPKPDAKPRKSITCADYLAMIDGAEPTHGRGATSRAGDWSSLNEAFRPLPEGAELCGATFITMEGAVLDGKGDMVSAYVRSPLGMPELEAFYGPIAAKAGCKPNNNVQLEWARHWSCPSNQGSTLALQVLPDYQIYGVSSLVR